MSRLHTQILHSTSIALVVSGSLLMAGCGKETVAKQGATHFRTVTLEPVQTGSDTPVLNVTGVVQNRDEAKLAFKVGGLVRDVLVREGDTVKTGQVLATLMADEVDASVTQADENFAKAQRDLDRGKKLFAEDVISQSQLDDLKTGHAIAQAGVRAARFNRGTAQLVATAPGTVLARLAQPKEVVGAGQPVLVVGDTKKGLVIKAGLSDRQVNLVKRGDAVRVTLDALPNRELAGEVLEVGMAADARVGTYRLEARLVLEQDKLITVLPGMVGRVRVSNTSSNSLTHIPMSALIEGDQRKAWVFIATQAKDNPAQYEVKRVEVEPAFIDEQMVALKKSLPQGTLVVTSGVSFINDGEIVVTADKTSQSGKVAP